MTDAQHKDGWKNFPDAAQAGRITDERPRAMQLCTGKFYRRADGEKIGPMYCFGGVWYSPSYPGDWTKDGENLHGYPKNSEYYGSTDLVDEWSEPAAVTVHRVNAYEANQRTIAALVEALHNARVLLSALTGPDDAIAQATIRAADAALALARKAAP